MLNQELFLLKHKAQFKSACKTSDKPQHTDFRTDRLHVLGCMWFRFCELILRIKGILDHRVHSIWSYSWISSIQKHYVLMWITYSISVPGKSGRDMWNEGIRMPEVHPKQGVDVLPARAMLLAGNGAPWHSEKLWILLSLLIWLH